MEPQGEGNTALQALIDEAERIKYHYDRYTSPQLMNVAPETARAYKLQLLAVIRAFARVKVALYDGTLLNAEDDIREQLGMELT
jgi:hypothetical protein